ncbi:hypothetical protein ILUMI_09536 [Ignelater luminosus]|uniref:Uncharacterized protein n=1 Tax=Ignelater luminosus TaxID=2038154 RepID=A0A8K0CZJ2_IGNLU|nr:hypothetical protein ILUMI_09536 [Ignelater luminosus]
MWGPKNLMVILDHGPLVLVTHLEASLSFASLIQQYLKMGKTKKAIALLLSWEWNDQCFSALQRIIAYLLKFPLTEENAQDVQNTLRSFHNSPVPLSTNIKHRYGSQVQALTRRFFHQLVRHKMFETAFLLAVDIGHHDLFMDLYYCAVVIGEKEMAAAARAQASALLSRCSSEASCCSHSLCSYCSDSCTGNSSSDNNHRENQTKFTSSDFVSSTPNAYNDNFLTTNFNDIDPKTYHPVENYKNSLASISSIELPKAVLPPRPNIYKSLSTSQNLPNNSSNFVNLTSEPPPLPVAPLIPIMPRLVNKNYSLQFGAPSTAPSSNTSFNNFISPPLVSYMGRQPSTTFSNSYNWNNDSLDVSFNSETACALPTINSTNLCSASLSNPVSSNPVSIPLSQNSLSTSCISLQSTNTNGGKKQQAKVKFSDTVTAFIVPEVKRTVRPPPPPHIADPQKELADSLPLCHPNEDYLKDFTPANRAEREESPSQSKIKVVHFGVV